MTDYSAATVKYGSSPTSITLLDMLKDQLEISDGSQDGELTLYLQLAGEAAERYTDNVIAKKSVTENLRRFRSPVALHYYPYVDNLEVSLDGTDVTADFEVIKGPGFDTAVRDRCGLRRECCLKPLTITYDAGWDPLPADLGFAIVQGAMGYELGGDQGGPASRESVTGLGTIQYAGASDGVAIGMGMFPGSAVAVLDRYRRYSA